VQLVERLRGPLCPAKSGSYFDWTADLSSDEFREMHETFRAQTAYGMYAATDWQKVLQPKMQAIGDAMAGTLGEISRINVLPLTLHGRANPTARDHPSTARRSTPSPVLPWDDRK
jgi:hypothetical protein